MVFLVPEQATKRLRQRVALIVRKNFISGFIVIKITIFPPQTSVSAVVEPVSGIDVDRLWVGQGIIYRQVAMSKYEKVDGRVL